MRPWRSAEHPEDGELNVVPMMNLFVALVPILLLSAVFVHVSAIDLAGGGPAAASSVAAPPAVVITEHEVQVGPSLGSPPARRIDRTAPGFRAELAAVLAGYRAEAGGPEVVIASAPGVRYQDLVSVIDVAAGAGFSSFSLAAAGERAEERRHDP